MRSGTTTMPPPTPKSAEKTPATRPIATRRTGSILWSHEDRAGRLRPRWPLAGALGAAAATAGAGRAVRRRPDPRMCPSPRCGGYWVALANRARTRCSDGVLRPLLRRERGRSRRYRSGRDPRRSARARRLEPRASRVGSSACSSSLRPRARRQAASGRSSACATPASAACGHRASRAGRPSTRRSSRVSELDLRAAGLTPDRRRRAAAAARRTAASSSPVESCAHPTAAAASERRRSTSAA